MSELYMSEDGAGEETTMYWDLKVPISLVISPVSLFFVGMVVTSPIFFKVVFPALSCVEK
jgi:hypothetical protein